MASIAIRLTCTKDQIEFAFEEAHSAYARRRSFIGIVVAPDEDAAIKHAIKDLAIDQALHSRLIAREMIEAKVDDK